MNRPTIVTRVHTPAVGWETRMVELVKAKRRSTDAALHVADKLHRKLSETKQFAIQPDFQTYYYVTVYSLRTSCPTESLFSSARGRGGELSSVAYRGGSSGG